MTRSCPHRVTALLATLLLAATAPALAGLNDTGQTTCVAGNGTVDCPGTGQDGDEGRDEAFPDSADGAAGFAFVKIGPNGRDLPADATEWSCVRDQVTGLTWEVKNDGGDLRDKDNTYTNRGDGRRVDAATWVDLANRNGLCGHQDWRLPTRDELLGLVHYGQPVGRARIDRRWFPRTVAAAYWAVDGDAAHPDAAWSVHFGSGAAGTAGRGERLAARLVRQEGAVPPRFVPEGDEVNDVGSGLVWRRCVEGQAWTGSGCAGTPLLLGWVAALDHARAQAAGGTPWRLPNVKELASLTDTTRTGPAIDPTAFPDTPAGYTLSATHEQGDPFYVWGGILDTGDVVRGLRAQAGVMRLVRTADPFRAVGAPRPRGSVSF
jgi:hypothetical protein